MRVIGRNRTGQIVGYFERQADVVVGERFDPALRLLSEIVFDGFRESMAWLSGLGAERVEIVG